MIRSIAFIHTVALLIDRFRPRFQEELPQQRCFHMLDESVLQDLLRDGPTPAINQQGHGVDKSDGTDHERGVTASAS